MGEKGGEMKGGKGGALRLHVDGGERGEVWNGDGGVAVGERVKQRPLRRRQLERRLRRAAAADHGRRGQTAREAAAEE